MKNQQPLFHVVKRESGSPARQLLAYVAAVVLALAVGAVLLAVQGVEPVTFYKQLLTMGIPGSRYPWRAVVALRTSCENLSHTLQKRKSV